MPILKTIKRRFKKHCSHLVAAKSSLGSRGGQFAPSGPWANGSMHVLPGVMYTENRYCIEIQTLSTFASRI